MEDEASGGGDRLPSNLTGEFSGAGVGADDSTSHTPSQSQADRPNVQVPSHVLCLPAMADRERRSRVERACSNIPTAQSRNSSQQHRRHDDQAGGNGGVPEARNRHRDRNPPTTGRQRSMASSSAHQRAAAEAEVMEDDSDDDVKAGDLTVELTCDLTLLPILETDFVQGLQSSVPSTHNWQVCC